MTTKGRHSAALGDKPTLLPAPVPGPEPPTEVMPTFVDQHRGEYGVAPICAVLPIAPG